MSSLNCKRCPGYKSCVLIQPIVQDREPWWHFGEIRFCVFQVIWLVSHRKTMESGDWPPEYREVEGSNKYAHQAKFVRPVLIIAEVLTRIDKCGVQGRRLIDEVDDGRSYHNLSSGAREAVMYAQGFKRKRTSFGHWVRDVFYKRKKEG